MLKAGWGRVGSAAADGRSVAQAAAASTQGRQEPPMGEQRPELAAPTRRRRPAPLAPCRRYSRLIPSLRLSAPGPLMDRRASGASSWRGAPARRTDCA
jgi:hypothetical protein